MRKYLDLVQQVLDEGEERGDRTGTGTISLFGTQTRYDLREGFPILTTKKVNFKAVKAELFWFLRGSTNISDLNSKIWDEWADEDGDLGPVYGAQWRNWGGTYCKHQGIDQIKNAITTIQRNPDSRRIIVSAWNVEEIKQMALPPCHVLFQFCVSADGKSLDCQLYQRSADLALGVPFNVASYALLLSLVAKECGLQPRYFIHSIGDAHVYLNHVEGLREQLTRAPKALPELVLADVFFDLQEEADPFLDRYYHHPAIKFKVSV